MGYCVNIHGEVSFKVSKFNEVKKAVLKALEEGEFTKGAVPEYEKLTNFEELFYSLGFEGNNEADGIFTMGDFCGEKLHEEDVIFSAIMPFAEKGSKITFDGEDGKSWEYRTGIMTSCGVNPCYTYACPTCRSEEFTSEGDTYSCKCGAKWKAKKVFILLEVL